MYKIDYQFIYSSQMPANGPAIKLVGVAELMKAVTRKVASR